MAICCERGSETKPYFDDIFIVLTYKNTKDIIEFLDSLQSTVKNYKVILINSFYSESTKNTFAEIAANYQCDYLPVENNGYGFGNNVGIKHTLLKYDFKRIVISNPDIVIKQYNQKGLDNIGSGVFGGCIINARGKKQNPLRVIDWSFTNNSAYYLYVKKNKILFYSSVIFSKISRLIFIKNARKVKRVFAIHGSFLVISKDVIEENFPLFDERIFMFEEEIDIAKHFREKHIPVYYTDHIYVFHKEDGDVNVSNINNAKIMFESCSYVYEKWKK